MFQFSENTCSRWLSISLIPNLCVWIYWSMSWPSTTRSFCFFSGKKHTQDLGSVWTCILGVPLSSLSPPHPPAKTHMWAYFGVYYILPNAIYGKHQIFRFFWRISNFPLFTPSDTPGRGGEGGRGGTPKIQVWTLPKSWGVFFQTKKAPAGSTWPRYAPINQKYIKLESK